MYYAKDMGAQTAHLLPNVNEKALIKEYLL